MRGIEDHARGPEIDFQWIDRAGFQEVFLLEAVAEAGANGSFTQIERTTVRIDVAKARNKVGVGNISREPDFRAVDH